MSETQQERLSLTPEAATALLARRAQALAVAHSGQRLAIGLAGGPGVGKSTIAVEAVNASMPARPALRPMCRWMAST